MSKTHRRPTTQDAIDNLTFAPGKAPAIGDLMKSDGFKDVGDGGNGTWEFKGVTGQTPSQSPAQLGDALLNDASGNQWSLVRKGRINILSLGGAGDNSFDNSPVRAAAFNALSGGTVLRGGQLYLPSGIYLMDGYELPSLIILLGESRGSSVIKLKNGANTDLMTIPATTDQCGWARLTFNGNRANNTSGRGIYVAAGEGGDGTSFSPYTDKANNSPYSYKHIVASDFAVGNCAGDGLRTEPSNFQIFMDNFVCSHNGNDGLAIFSSDGLYSNFFCEKNDRMGFHGSGAANKFSNFKAIWNGRVDNTFGGFRDQGTNNVYINGETQDNYTHGLVILGTGSQFINQSSNTNGYLSLGNEDQSSGIHYDILIGAAADGISFIGEVHTYKTTTGSDGKWVTQEPYHFNTFSTTQFNLFICPFDASKYNALPNVILSKTQGRNILSVGAFSSNGSDVNYDTDITSPDAAGDQVIRLFRNTPVTTGLTRMIFFDNGTSTETTEIRSNGFTNLSKNNVQPVIIGDSSTGGNFDGALFRMGSRRLFFDASNRLRFKDGADPASETDGIIVGTQS